MSQSLFSGIISKPLSLKQTKNGVKVEFSIKVYQYNNPNRVYSWVPLVAFNNKARQIVKSFKENDSINVKALYESFSWTEKGQKKYSHSFVIEHFERSLEA